MICFAYRKKSSDKREDPHFLSLSLSICRSHNYQRDYLRRPNQIQSCQHPPRGEVHPLHFEKRTRQDNGDESPIDGVRQRRRRRCSCCIAADDNGTAVAVLGTRYPVTVERACIVQTRDNARWCWLRWSAPPPPPDNPTCSPRAHLIASRNFPTYVGIALQHGGARG